MCGIAGLVVKSEKNYDFSKFKSATSLIAHRGPDNFGEYYGDNIALFHYRLSILDLDERSNQPFFNESKDKVMVYNGEVYNFKEIASKYNLKLRTTSDTEVIMKTFEVRKDKAYEEWNGIFAMAIYDSKEQTLTLARDRFGVKPLYVYEDESFIAFSSEAKVILNWLNNFSINLQGLSEYLWYGNTLSNQTLINNLIKFTPGTSVVIDLKNFTKDEKIFWSISDNVKTIVNEPFENAITKSRDLLENAVRRQLVSDVPVGIFLSGGIDSSAVTAFASRNVAGKISTYSVEYDFNIGGESELPKAALIAKKFNTNHHELKVEAKNITQDFEDLVFQYDEPFADPANLPLYLLAKKCKDSMTVVLQGDGGDELFAGYRRYKLLNNLSLWKYNSVILSNLLPLKFLRRRASRMALTLDQESDALRMALLMTQTTPLEKPELIFNRQFQTKLSIQSPFKRYFEENDKFITENLAQRMLYTDFEVLLPHTYLEKVDKATMLTSIEARVPFLDNELTQYVLSLPSDYKVKWGIAKYILKKSLTGIVPDEILNAKKRGFDTPTSMWLRTTLYEYAKEKFSAFKDKSDILDINYLQKLLEEHKNQVKNHNVILWKALVLLTWLEIYKDKIDFNFETPRVLLKPQKKKKIVLVLPSLVMGGMERVMSTLGSYFSDVKNAEVHLILLGRTDHFYPISKKVKVHEPDFKFDKRQRLFHTLKAILYFRKKIKKLDPDAILSFGELWNNFVLFSTLGLTKRNGKRNRIFVSDRSQPDKALGLLHDNLRIFLYKRAAGLIVQTNKAKEINEKRINSSNIKVIPNPIRKIESNGVVRQNIILSVGRLIRTKNHDRLIKLFLELNLKDWKLIIVGDGPERKRLEQLIKQTSSENKVLLAGNQKNVEEFYTKSKIFAFTSSSEGFPNVLGEALSAGLAVISFDCIAGPADMIQNNENGILVTVNDYEKFKKELNDLVHDEEKIHRFSKNARKISDEFSVESICEKFYESII